MAAIHLTENACEALRREAEFELKNACSEYARSVWDDEAEAAKQRRVILCAGELTGALERAERDWPRIDTPVGPRREGLHGIEFSPDLTEWLIELREGIEGHLADLGRGGDTSVFEYEAQMALLSRTLDRVADAEAVAAR